MKTTESPSPVDSHRQQIENWLGEGNSIRKVAVLCEKKLGFETSERSIRRALRRWGHGPLHSKFEKPGTHVHGDEAEIISDPRSWKNYLNDYEALMTERGLDPDEWEVSSLVINEWDSPTGETLKQLKAHCKRKRNLEMVVPARVELGSVWKTRRPVSPPVEPELVVFVSDQHAPYQEPDLHLAFCEFLSDQQPERGFLIGDTLDLPTISRHAPEPDWAPTTQECIDSAGQMLLDYREASPETHWIKLPGNHDERLRRIVIDRLGEWYGLKPAQVEGLPDLPPIHDPVHLLRLDELGIEFLRPKGSYEHGQAIVSKHLAARHGYLAKKGAGASAHATLDHLGHSVVVGHTHRQAIVNQTKHDLDGTVSIRTAAEIGCMCQIGEGLGYTANPDWQQGFCTASVYTDGTFRLDLATFITNRLYWRSERY